MARRKVQPNRVDELLDDLLADCHSPEDIVGESGLLKQLSQRLIERALAGELNHHLKTESAPQASEPETEAPEPRRNSRNGYSAKTVQSQQGAMELAIPRDRNGEFEPV
jgi:putative transposase